MNPLRKIFCCPKGNHRPDTHRDIEVDHPSGGRIRYAKCLDCGNVIACRPPYGGSDQWRAITGVLCLLPLDHYEILRKLGIVGLTPPEPWPTAPGGHSDKRPADPTAKPPQTLGSVPGFHGGPIPGLGDSPDLSNPETLAQLQEMLPQGSKSSAMPLSGVKVEVVTKDAPFEPIAPLDLPAFDGRQGLPQSSQLMVQVEAVFAKLRNKRAEHEARGRFKDHVYGAIAETIAMLGTCCRLKVGCVLLTKEGRVAGLGYNGAGPGMDHCHEDHCNETCRCLRTLHAEQNALYSRNGDPVVAYVTNEPCLNCTKELALAGVRRVVYLKPYTSIAEAERTARQEWIDHYRITWEALNDPSSPA